MEEAQEILEKVDKSNTGAVNEGELRAAVNEWFVHCAEKREDIYEAEEKERAAAKKKSGVCSIM